MVRTSKTFPAVPPEPLKVKDGRVTLVELKSGRIELETGADGVYLRFDADCRDALPYCRAACCALPGITVSRDEERLIPAESLAWNGAASIHEMKRAATGWCRENDPATRLCRIYEDRPATCRDFHCTRGSGMRGWLLGLNRLPEVT